jgi:WD40 repeat protein
MSSRFAAMAFVAALAQSVSAQPKPEREITIEVPKGRFWNEVSWIGFSPGGQYLAVRQTTAKGLDVVRVWDRTNPKPRFEWALIGALWTSFRCGPTCTFSPDGHSLVVALSVGSKAFHLTDPPPEPLKPLDVLFPQKKLPSEMSAGAVWVGGKDRLWRASTDPETPRVRVAVNRLSRPGDWEILFDERTADRGTVKTLALSPDGRRIAVCWVDDTGSELKHGLNVWDVNKKAKALTFAGHEGPVSIARYTPDGKVLATGSADGSVKLWNMESGKELAAIKGTQFTVTGLAFDTDGRRLAYCTYDRQGAPNLRLVDVEAGKYLAGIPADLSGVSNVCFDAGGERVAVYCNAPRVIRVFSVDAILKAEK